MTLLPPKDNQMPTQAELHPELTREREVEHQLQQTITSFRSEPGLVALKQLLRKRRERARSQLEQCPADQFLLHQGQAQAFAIVLKLLDEVN